MLCSASTTSTPAKPPAAGADLATIVKNRIRLKTIGNKEFDQLTVPTPLQQRAFDLLQVPCR